MGAGKIRGSNSKVKQTRLFRDRDPGDGIKQKWLQNVGNETVKYRNKKQKKTHGTMEEYQPCKTGQLQVPKIEDGKPGLEVSLRSSPDQLVAHEVDNYNRASCDLSPEPQDIGRVLDDS